MVYHVELRFSTVDLKLISFLAFAFFEGDFEGVFCVKVVCLDIKSIVGACWIFMMCYFVVICKKLDLLGRWMFYFVVSRQEPQIEG